MAANKTNDTGPNNAPSLQDYLTDPSVVKSTDYHPTQEREHLTHQQYIDEMLPHAQAIHEKWGVPVSVTLAQGSIESNWGNRHPDNVYFGIKGYAPDGKSVMLTTHEEVKGKLVEVQARFRAYDSLGAAVDDYGRVLKTNPAFVEAFNHPNDGQAFLKAVAEGGYATNSNYLSMVSERMRGHGMERYDDRSPRIRAEATLPLLPGNRDVAASNPVTRAVEPTNAQELWLAVAERGRQSAMARQAVLANYDPTAAQVGPSLMPSENNATIRKDMVYGWKAASQAGADVSAQQQAAATPVAAPSAPRMKP